jgi:hypothetical protein
MTQEQREAVDRLKRWRACAANPDFTHPYYQQGRGGDALMRSDTWIVANLYLDSLAAKEKLENAHA